MTAEFLPGALAPLGYFDPLGFCAGKTEGQVKVGFIASQIDVQTLNTMLNCKADVNTIFS